MGQVQSIVISATTELKTLDSFRAIGKRLMGRLKKALTWIALIALNPFQTASTERNT